MNKFAAIKRRLAKGCYYALPLAVMFCSYALCIRGIQWAYLNPDERKIAGWLQETAKQPYITDRAYPGGFFELYRPIRAVENALARVSENITTWQQQNPSAVADKGGSSSLLRVRHLNASFIALSCLFVFFMAKRMFHSLASHGVSAVSTFAAALTAFIYGTSPFLVEHAHYGETEGAMALMGALTLMLLTYALTSLKAWQLLLASVSLGFAIGCKYTLLPIIMILPACVLVFGRCRRFRFGKTVFFLMVTLVLAVAGFALATPALYHDFSFFVSSMKETSLATYNEMHGLLGRMAEAPGAARLFKTQCFSTEAAKLGLFWWVWFVLALPFWLAPRVRRYAVVLPLFGLCFALYVVFAFPWFRNQEFIPLLPLLAVTTVLPFAFADFRMLASPRAKILTALSFVAMCWIAASNFMDGAKMSSAFAGAESKTEMGRWLYTSAPNDVKFGFEKYASREGGFPPVTDCSIQKVEVNALDAFKLQNIDYVVRSANYLTRGTVDPRTGRLYDDLAANLVAFTNQAVLLKSWKLPQTDQRPIFSQTDLELWYANTRTGNETDAGNLHALIDQPFAINWGRYTHTAFGDGYAIGPQQAVQITGKTTDVYFRSESDTTWYGVAFYPFSRTGAGDASVFAQWRTAGTEPHKAELPYRGAALFSIRPSSPFSLFPRERIKLKGNDQTAICLLMPYADPVPASHLLRTMGNPKAALDLLSGLSAEKLGKTGAVEAFLASCASGVEPKPDWRQAAIQAASVDKISGVSGIPLDVLQDFSRMRLKEIQLGVHGDIVENAKKATMEAELPILLMPGQYTLKCRIDMDDGDWIRYHEAGLGARFDLLPLKGDIRFAGTSFTLQNGSSDVLELTFEVSMPAVPRLKAYTEIKTDSPFILPTVIMMKDIELTWRAADAAMAAKEQITEVLRQHPGK